jgi:hypothetical protein
MLLTAAGYDASTAKHGFDAPLQSRRLTPVFNMTSKLLTSPVKDSELTAPDLSAGVLVLL